MEWLKLSEEDRRKIIDQLSITTKLSPQAIEKDWWVTMVLKALFSSKFASDLSFKGGTSLSKCWDLIQRFSEDIDIAVSKESLGFKGELSKTQISDKLRRASCKFAREDLKQELEQQLLNLGIDKDLFNVSVNVTPVTTTDPEIIEVEYKSLYTDKSYIRNKVLVEVSGRSMSEPVEQVEIQSIIGKSLPTAKYADSLFKVNAVSPKRTFLEKAFLLHEEFKKGSGNIRVDRMSRHLYDLEKMMDTDIEKEALGDTELYKSIIEHRKKFIGLLGMDYSTLLPNTISFIPPDEIIKDWKEDYEAMQSSMIYGDSLSFDDLIKRITKLNDKFKAIVIKNS